MVTGPGGKVEEGEEVSEAMRREFREETGIDVSEFDWTHVADLRHPDYVVCFFRTHVGNITAATIQPGESERLFVQSVHEGHHRFFPNARTALALALDPLMKYPVTLNYHGT